MLFALSACGKDSPAAFVVKKDGAALTVSADTDKKALYLSKERSKMKRIAKSDMTELYFDSETCTVSVYDTASGKLWSSLPAGKTKEKASALSVTVLIKGNRYTLSSQSDSVGFSSALYEENENGVTVKYGFKRTLEDGTAINLFIPVSYTLSDGALSVEADFANLIGENHDRDVIVTEIDILPFFGSDTKGGDGDYMLLPDGCGVTVDLSENPDKFKNVSLPVYENGNILGAFGMKRGDSAFVALIDEGDEFACVKGTKSLSSGGSNRAYASFEITPYKTVGDEVYVCKESYNGKIRILYRFLSYGNADYVGMAGAVRELLIRDGSLLSKAKEENSAYPFNLSVVFQNSITDSKGRTLSQTLTTYSRAQEILDSLRSKGIENINVRLKGVLSDNEFSEKPGKLKELEALLSSGDGEAISFYADADIASSAKGSNYATGLDGGKIMLGDKAFLSPSQTEDNINALLTLVRKNGIQGVCISDGAAALYADFSGSDLYMKDSVADILSKQIGAASASGKLMVDTGNIYGIKYADTVVNLPSSAKLQSREICTAVPFVQSVLHGLTDYSLEAVNKSKNSEKAFLKSIEFGAVPYYEWYAADLSSQDKKDKSSYINNITEAQNQYERAASAFEDLREARITDHYRVKKNVYYTGYDNSTGVYVNYNSKAVSVNGVTVEGMSFLRVN